MHSSARQETPLIATVYTSNWTSANDESDVGWYKPRKRRKLLNHISEDKYTPGYYDADIIHLKDMQFKYALLFAQIDIVRRGPSL